MGHHGRGYVLSPNKTGTDELIGVRPVGLGAARAARRPPVTACHKQPVGGLFVRVVVEQDLAGSWIDDLGAAVEMDWIGAPTRRADHLSPASETRISSRIHQDEDLLVGEVSLGAHRTGPSTDCREVMLPGSRVNAAYWAAMSAASGSVT